MSDAVCPESDTMSTVADLLRCVQYNKLDEMRALIASGVDINCVHDGHTALSLAAQAGKMPAVAMLLETGRCRLSVGEGMWLHQQALHHAARHDRDEVVKLLLTANALVDERDAEKRTPLHWAASNCNLNIARLLLAHGGTVDAAQRDGDTPLHIAARLGDTNMCEHLITAGADVNCADPELWTPLHVAAAYGYDDLVSLFFAHGAHVDQRNAEGQTALLVAAELIGTSLTGRLLSKIHRDRDRTGTNYPLELDILDVVCSLLDMGADPSAHCRMGCSLVRLACDRSVSTLLWLLVAAGAELCSEPWLRVKKNSPENSPGSEDSPLVVWLKDQAKQPRSLKMTSRILIRRCLMPCVRVKVPSLPIPVTLQDYISLRSGLYNV